MSNTCPKLICIKHDESIKIFPIKAVIMYLRNDGHSYVLISCFEQKNYSLKFPHVVKMS